MSNAFYKKICLAVLALLCIIWFWPSLFNQFTNWDDNVLLTQNPLVQHLWWANLKKIFDFHFLGYYPPLTVFSFALEYHFFQLNPFIYHLDNLLLHILNVGLVFILIQELGQNIRVAFLTAILFALSPLRVESVAWVTERKDVLFSCFFLLSMLAYMRQRFLISWAFFVLASLAKIQGVMLPFSLLLIDYYQQRTVTMKAWMNKIPFLLVCLLFTVLTLQGAWPHYTALNIFNVFDKIILCCFAMALYVFKILLPLDSCCIYPYPEKINGLFPWYVYASVGAIVIWGIALFQSWKYRSVFITGSLFFMVNILLALSSVLSGGYMINDRFTYLSSVGVYWIMATMIMDIFVTRWKPFVWAGLVIYVLMISFLTYERCRIWYDGVSLWSDAINQYPRLAFLYDNRGSDYVQKGQNEEALRDFSNAIQLNPRFASAYNNRAVIYDKQGRRDLALKDFNEAIAADPSYGVSYFNRSLFFSRLGLLTQAKQDAIKAQELGVK